MARIHIVLLSTVPCKIIGSTNGHCEDKYVETQTNQNSVEVGSLNECLKVVCIQPNIWPVTELVKKKIALDRYKQMKLSEPFLA